MIVRVDVVTPCPHGEYRMHQIQGEGNLVLRVCDDISRRSFTEWPPEAIEAAAKTIYTKKWGPSMSGAKPGPMEFDMAEAALAAAWGHITGKDESMSDRNEIPGDYKFPCRWCGGIRFVDPRRQGDHIRCWVMRWWRRMSA